MNVNQQVIQSMKDRLTKAFHNAMSVDQLDTELCHAVCDIILDIPATRNKAQTDTSLKGIVINKPTISPSERKFWETLKKELNNEANG